MAKNASLFAERDVSIDIQFPILRQCVGLKQSLLVVHRDGGIVNGREKLTVAADQTLSAEPIEVSDSIEGILHQRV
jgi:hypothetical protein